MNSPRVLLAMRNLDWIGYSTILAFLCIVIVQIYLPKTQKKSKKNNNSPPRPPSLPIIGHLHMLKDPLHKTLHEISTKYGGDDGVQMLRLGCRNVLLISSSSAVEECLVRNDLTFANRPDTLVGRLLHYNSTSMAFSPYNNHFRTLKRIMTQEVFSSIQIPRFSAIRQNEVNYLLKSLRDEINGSNKQVKINLNRGFNDLALNIMTKMAAGKRYYGAGVEDASEAKQFSEIIREGSVLSGSANPGDFLPMLKFLFRGLEKNMIAWMAKTDSFYQRLLDERKGMKNNETTTKAIIDVLISAQLQDPDFFTNEVIKGMIMVLILAGADTSASTMEWAMSLLLNNPEALKKAKEEIDTVIGHEHLITEEDLSNLPYLQNVITETLRLYPPTPVLLPHESSEDCTICGYDVPRGTMLMVSLWTIHRDPKNWNEPERFVPERFEGKEGETLYKLLPFGLGRRACPGYAMGKRAVGLVLGSLLQCFDWERPTESLIDMSQCTGLTMPKAVPLEALCKMRSPLAQVLAKEFDD